MRLTLRTLLAWLDDALPPEEAREIGKQVDETPYAQKLVERIRVVTRRRRLTVPPTSGPESVDPNTVAEYLDNVLEPDQVAELERRCLESDVHLAEVSSSHQILSLIRNKAKVPPESRYRMYRLVKGRESARTTPRALLSAPGVATVDQVPPWEELEPPRRSPVERLGPPLLAVALILVLLYIGWLNLREVPSDALLADPGVAGGPPPAIEPREAGDRPEGGPPPIPEIEENGDEDAPGPGLEPGPEEPGEARDGPDEAPEDDDPAAVVDVVPDADAGEELVDLPAGAVGAVESTGGGVLLRASEDGRSWTRLLEGETLRDGDRVVNLAPFRATLQVGTVRLVMVSQCDLRVEEPGEGRAARFELLDGSVSLRSPEADTPVAVGFEGREIVVDPPTGQPIGLSRFGLRAPGEPAGRPVFMVAVPGGTASASVDGGEPRELSGPSLASFDPQQGFVGVEARVPARWVTDPEPQPRDARAGAEFAAVFERTTGPLMLALLEGIEDDRPEIRSLSVAALGATGKLDQVMPLLAREGAPALRAAALGVIDRRMAEGPEEAAEVLDLVAAFAETPEVATDLRRLLVGYGEEEVAGGDAFIDLVDDLASPNPSVRQLAIGSLQTLTGRDPLGYDPDNPEGRGLEQWRNLLRSGGLGPNPPAGPGNGP